MAMRVLIVDDALFMRRMLADILKKEGFEICGEAENGKEGIDKYVELKPDVVTMDIVMPKMEEIDGVAAVREIIKRDPHGWCHDRSIGSFTLNTIHMSIFREDKIDFRTVMRSPKICLIRHNRMNNLFDNIAFP